MEPTRNPSRPLLPARQLLAAAALLLLVSVTLPGCATLRAGAEDGNALADSLALYNDGVAALGMAPDARPETAMAWWDSVAAEELPPERATWLEEHPEVRDLEDLFRQSLGLMARNLLDPADDLIYVLKRQAALSAPADGDSLTRVYRQSLDRRLILLSGLLAEERAARGDVAPTDSLLETAYAEIRGLVLPDTLAPIPQEARREIESQLLNVDNALVQQWITYFTGTGRRYFEQWLQRTAVTEPLVVEILTESGLPPELFYLSVIESGLNSNARSRVGAVGYWQFMPGTARHFSLRRDWWVDERRDLEMSTRAAATYLSQLYNYFQDWPLVLAAYNAGEGRVDRIIRRAGHRDFWRLPLPSQTRNHIPKFIAAHRIALDPARYGFDRANAEPLRYDVVPVDDATDLKVIARCAGVEDEVIRELNPALLRGVTPPGAEGYAVRVPVGRGPQCAQRLAEVPPGERVTWRRHTVRSGETLSGIAKKYGVTVAQLRDANRSLKSTLIHPGDELIVSVAAGKGQEVASETSRAGRDAGARAEETEDGLERVTYRVQRGDTLGGIARKLGVSLAHLRRVNNLPRSSLIHPGQRLVVYRPARAPAG